MIKKLFVFALFFSIDVHAQEVIDVLKRVRMSSQEGVSKQILAEKAVREVSIESIQGIIGEEKVQRSKDVIENKIIKGSERYILSTQAMNFTKKNSDYEMDVQIKLSLKSLRTLLLENGLLYQMDGPPKVLPIIQVVDRISGASYGWWFQSSTKEKSYLSGHLEGIHKSLREKLKEIGFYSMMPVAANYSKSVPEAYRGDNLQRADYLFLGEYFKSSIVVRGQIVYRAKPLRENVYLVDARIEALQSGNGRLMAEVVRTYETEAGPARAVINKKISEITSKLAEDLGLQLSESWKKGTFGASVVRIAVRSSITPNELEEFKKNVVLQVKDIKNMKERLIEGQKTTFEADSSSLPAQLAQVFRSTQFQKFDVQVDDVTQDELTLAVAVK